MEAMTINARLAAIQVALKAPKDLFNKFGNYRYRSAEGILETLKPLLGGLNITFEDDIIIYANMPAIKTWAILTAEDGAEVRKPGIAFLDMGKKGMDASQVTGSASSYARKYALNALFAIDDTKDSDYYPTAEKPQPIAAAAPKSAPRINVGDARYMAMAERINAGELDCVEKAIKAGCTFGENAREMLEQAQRDYKPIENTLNQ